MWHDVARCTSGMLRCRQHNGCDTMAVTQVWRTYDEWIGITIQFDGAPDRQMFMDTVTWTPGSTRKSYMHMSQLCHSRVTVAAVLPVLTFF